MRRTGTHNNGHPGGPSEFHLDIPQIPIWQNNSMPPPPPIHLQLLPTNINGHPTGLDHLMNNGGEQLDQSAYMHNFMYSSSAQATPFNGNGTVYFTHPATPMATAPPSSSSQPSQTHFHQFHPTRTFENSNRHQYHHSSHFQSSPVFQATPPVPPSQVLTPSSSSSHLQHHHHHQQQQQDNSSTDIPPRFRRLKRSDQDNKYSQSRPMSGDFDHLRNSFSRFNNENRYQSRPQSFYDFSSQQPSTNNFFRSSSNNNNNNLTNRYQRNNNNNNNNNNNTNSLPLSAYMNTDENSYSNENNYWGTSTYQRRRSNQQQQQQRNYYQDKHQFPLSSYDPRQYGFNNNYSRRNDLNNRPNSNRRLNNTNNNNTNSNRIDDSNDIDLIEEWWEDDNPELIGTNQPQTNTDSQTTTATVDDSGNSSLSTSMHLKESTLDDEEDENNRSINDSVNAPSDTSIIENNIIESLDKLQEQLKLEEAVEKQLVSHPNQLVDELSAMNKETTTYDTAHFLQWAKEKFREELTGRLTAKEIEQHDAVTSDDDDNEDLVVTTGMKLEEYQMDQITDDDIDHHVDELEDDLNEKLTIEEKTNQAIIVE